MLWARTAGCDAAVESESGGQNEAPPALLCLGSCGPCNDLPRSGATLWCGPCCSISECQNNWSRALPAKALLPVRAVCLNPVADGAAGCLVLVEG